jgi:hypothetical protein
MFELADRLVGIYKTNDATKSVTINPKLFENATAGRAPSAAGTGAWLLTVLPHCRRTCQCVHEYQRTVTV